MSNSIGWNHPTDEADQWDGFNDSGIETFAGSPVRSLAREVNQNALDAVDSGTVKVCIRLHTVPTDSIPNLSELKKNLAACARAAKEESKKARVFFENAIAELGKKKITVLEVSDFNTTGMKGPSENGTAFYAFMKARGQSKKDSGTATGSYGIGKFAPYAVSKLRTIFVSTIFKDDAGQYRQLTQGKSILMSHDVGLKRKIGVGFWGVKVRCQPVQGVNPKLPNWMQRAAKENDLALGAGSKLTILGFEATKDWQEVLAVSVAENFFAALYRGELSVDIDNGKHVLEKTTIRKFLDSAEIRSGISQFKGEPATFDCIGSYLSAIQKSGDAIVEESERRELGLCRIHILLKDGLPRKTCVLRNGMFITDELRGLKSFSGFKDFVAVVECHSTKGNELLRAMEPPKHDDFEPERLPAAEERTKGERALKDLAGWVRDMLKRHAKDPVSDVTEIDELREFFSDEGPDGTGKGVEEINPYGDVLIRAKPIRMPSVSSVRVGDGDERGEGEGGDGGGGSTGAGSGDGRGGKGKAGGGSGGAPQKLMAEVRNIRAIPQGIRGRRVAFTPSRDAKVEISFLEAGADSDYEVSVESCSRGMVQNGVVQLGAVAGIRVDLNVVFQTDLTGALKVVVHEV